MAAAVAETPVDVQAPSAAPATVRAQMDAEACPCGAPFAPDAAFCLRCGTRRGPPSAPTQEFAGVGPPVVSNPMMAYAPSPMAFDQAASAGPPPQWTDRSHQQQQQQWLQQNACMSPGGQAQFPWPTQQPQMMPYGAQPMGPPWGAVAPNGDWAAYMPADQQMAMMNSPRFQPNPNSPRFQLCSPRLQPCSPRMLDQAGAAYPPSAGGDHGEGPSAGADSKKESLLPCRPCRFSCKRRCPKPSKPQCNCCKNPCKGRRCCSCGFIGALRSMRRSFMESPTVASGRWRRWPVVALGFAAIGCLLAALLDDPPHLMAAGLASALGYLACYTYMLQRDCWRLKRDLEMDLSRQLGGVAGGKEELQEPPVEAVPPLGSVDLDVTGLARSLGSAFCNSMGSVAPGKGKSGQTMQAVLTSALVNEYLRCSSALQKYQSRHGILPNAPQYNAGFAEALLVGLHGSASGANMPPMSARTSTGSLTFRSNIGQEAGARSPHPAVNKGTPNFADRLTQATAELAQQDTSPGLVRNSPFTEAQKSSSSQENPSPGHTGASSVPPQPPAGELERCTTIDNASGAPLGGASGGGSFAPSAEASPEVDRGPAARAEARGDVCGSPDVDANDPPWLRGLVSPGYWEQKTASDKMQDVDNSVNDPPWLRGIRKN